MTVSSQTNKVIYVGNGVAKEFAIPFSFLEQEHIKVRQKKNDIQTERTDWTVKSGNLVFAIAPESGAEIAIVREVPLTQETDYRDNEILHAETLERNFDKLTMQVQQLAEKSARAVTVDIFDDTAADSLIPSIRKAVSDCQTAAVSAQSSAAEAATTFASKATVNADNFTTAGKSILSGLSMPSNDYISLNIGASGIQYIAPANGWFSLCGFATADSGFATMDVPISGNSCMAQQKFEWYSRIHLPVKKGDKMILDYISWHFDFLHFTFSQGEK